MKLVFGMAIVIALLGTLGYFHYRQSILLAGRLVRNKGRGKDKNGASSEGNPVYGPTNGQEVNPSNGEDRA